MNIASTQLESFQEALKQASKVLKCSNYSERLELVNNMQEGVLQDIFTT